jgi:hypothetical protein
VPLGLTLPPKDYGISARLLRDHRGTRTRNEPQLGLYCQSIAALRRHASLTVAPSIVRRSPWVPRKFIVAAARWHGPSTGNSRNRFIPHTTADNQ